MASMPTTARYAQKFERLCAILDHHARRPSRLIPILQAIQHEYNYLPEEVLTYVATSLGVPPARVFGVATFYSHFAMEPKGKHSREVSIGIARHYSGKPVVRDGHTESQLREALRSVGKHSADDELNCGGCDYESCRDF